MSKAKKPSVGVQDAMNEYHKAARTRRRSAWEAWRDQKLTFAELGKRFGVSRQRASQMVRRAEREIGQ